MKQQEAFLLVDGYNIIHAWPKLRKIVDYSLEAARDKLLQILSNYGGMNERQTIIVVFDAQKVKGGIGSVLSYDKVKVVYTQEAETADSYIEKAVTDLARHYTVRVATSDGLEQIIILSKGAYRLSANDLQEEVRAVERQIQEKIRQIKPVKNNELIANLDQKTAEWMEKMRRGHGL